jgi:hypothetical protein
MINNFEQIKELLDWRSEDDFYFIQILQRKKDHKEGKINGSNNNSRLIKAYYLKSIEHLEFLTPEIIQLCEVFNARAGINLNRRSFKKMQLQHQKKCIDQQLNGTYNKVHKAYNTVVGAFNHDSDKKWIIDIDEPYDENEVRGMVEMLKNYQPLGPKMICKIPSKSGYHLITKSFNIKQAKEDFPGLDIHKNNPTNLYIP